MKSIKLASAALFTLVLTACSSTSSTISLNTSTNPSSSSLSPTSSLVSSTIPSTTINSTIAPSSTPTQERYVSSKSEYQDIIYKGNSQSLLPSIGEPNILVIPVIFKGFDFVSLDSSLSSNEEAVENIADAFFGEREEGEIDSLASYYEKSSYGKLRIKGTVTDIVTAPQSYSSYSRLTIDSATSAITGIIQTALVNFNSKYDYSYFDTDLDSYFDSIWLIYSAPRSTTNMFWAFVDWISARSSYDGINIGPYAWASYDFLNNVDYGEHKDTHTLIHETGHLLGLTDYYNNEGTYPVGGLDMMDFSVGDHMALNKYDFGWIEPNVIKSSGNYNLKPLHSDGEAYIIGAPRYNDSPFWEYYIIEYYQPKGLNKRDSESVYSTGVRMFTESGIRVFHVNQKLKYYNGILDTDSEYINDITNIRNEPYIMVNSNSATTSYNNKDTSVRLVSIISSNPNHRYTSLATNDDLFQEGDSYDGSNILWEDESKLNFKLDITTMNDESISFSIDFIEE